MPLGAAALVRLAGVPFAVWAGAGSPALFVTADRLAARQNAFAVRAHALSARLGEEVVPDGRLATADRRAVLALRRRLHAVPTVTPSPPTPGAGADTASPVSRGTVATVQGSTPGGTEGSAASAAGAGAACGADGSAVHGGGDGGSAGGAEAGAPPGVSVGAAGGVGAGALDVSVGAAGGAEAGVPPGVNAGATGGAEAGAARDGADESAARGAGGGGGRAVVAGAVHGVGRGGGSCSREGGGAGQGGGSRPGGGGGAGRGVAEVFAWATGRGSGGGAGGAGLLGCVPVADRIAGLAPALAGELRALAGDEAELRGAYAAFTRQVAAERERAGTMLLETARTEPALREFLRSAAPRVVPDLERHAAAGEPWGGKRQRKGVGYLWRALGRAAAKTTPRDWAGQLAVLPVRLPSRPARSAASPGGPSYEDGTVLLPGPAPEPAETAARRTENVHLLWSRLRDLHLGTAAPHVLLAPAPLHHVTGDVGSGHLHVCVVDPGPGGGRLRWLTLRRTEVLEAVMEALAATPRTLAALEAAVGPPSAQPVLRSFLAHLHSLGVLQVCAAPHAARLPWTPTRRTRHRTAEAGPGSTGELHTAEAVLPGTVGRGAFLDSYRKLRRPPSARKNGTGAGHRDDPYVTNVPQVAEGLALARRLSALCESERPSDSGGRSELPEAASLGPAPVPVLRLLEARQEADEAAGGPRPRPGPPRGCWEPARSPGSAYARLLAHLGARLGEEQIDIDGALLDELGAPQVPALLEAWPADCLLRPLPAPAAPPSGADGAGTGPHHGRHSGPLAVLESASPAGVIDARFAEALDELHAPRDPYAGYPGPACYRDFLAAFERRAGVRFVEVLVPPLGEEAANAVRRPVLTSWCTGDPNTPLYHGLARSAVAPAGSPAATPLPPVRHLPLDRITLRVADGALVAEADGVRLLPAHHATRTAAPPYDRLLRLLTAAGHPATRHMVRLDGLAGAFPDAPRVPRLTVGGLLVVSPAQWRLPRAALWRPTDPEPVKAGALAALRRTARLPRFGYLRARPDAKPLPVDLAALPALQAVERLCQAEPSDDLILEEALPSPDGLPLTAPTGTDGDTPRGVAAQLLLRLPHDRTAEELADRAYAAWCGAPGLPGPPPSHGGGGPGRTPHPQ
ncbi:hypothetical protein G3260_001893 [Streptomyces albus]|uniref:lantibiotic dehydratase n=1 Tax=Streptomyces TaxID=1883 RepID=UPI000689A46D|nr:MULTISPECIES: lantibiotic dehydratase [Streptomyces]QID35856.1 hypothetical protein G3260_001893 [Streptomyces albus]